MEKKEGRVTEGVIGEKRRKRGEEAGCKDEQAWKGINQRGRGSEDAVKGYERPQAQLSLVADQGFSFGERKGGFRREHVKTCRNNIQYLSS